MLPIGLECQRSEDEVEVDGRSEADAHLTEDLEGGDGDDDADTFDRLDTRKELESATKKTKAEIDGAVGSPKLSDVEFKKPEAKD